MAIARNDHPNTDKCQELVDSSIALGVAASVFRGLTIVAETAYNATDAFANQEDRGRQRHGRSAIQRQEKTAEREI